jgi:hypothetical protein
MQSNDSTNKLTRTGHRRRGRVVIVSQLLLLDGRTELRRTPTGVVRLGGREAVHQGGLPWTLARAETA